MKVEEILNIGDEYLDEVLVTQDGTTLEVLTEGRKWIPGRFDRNIGIDQPSHLAGQTRLPGQASAQPHAHVLGRKGEELGVVNMDGSSSHGSRFKLHAADAEALRARGFQIPPTDIIEWTRLNVRARILLLG